MTDCSTVVVLEIGLTFWSLNLSPLCHRTKTSGHTSENSFVCTPSFLQTEQLLFYFKTATFIRLNRRIHSVGFLFAYAALPLSFSFFLLYKRWKLCLNRESWMCFFFFSDQTWNKDGLLDHSLSLTAGLGWQVNVTWCRFIRTLLGSVWPQMAAPTCILFPLFVNMCT